MSLIGARLAAKSEIDKINAAVNRRTWWQRDEQG